MNKYEMEPRYATREAIDFLSERLSIGNSGQDWEIVHADPNKLEKYLLFYEQESLDDDQRFALMGLIAASYDEELARNSECNKSIWGRIRRHLCERFSLHAYTVEYWSLTDNIPDDDNPDTQFAITPRMRDIMYQFLGPRENWPTSGFAIRRFSEPVGHAPEVVLNSIEISAGRNGMGFYATWSAIPGPNWGERFFATAQDAQHWAEEELGVKRNQWKEI